MTRFAYNKTMAEVWLKYYSKYFDDLIIFVCGYENYDGYKELSTVDKKYKYETIGGSDIYSLDTHYMVFKKQKELVESYDWVIYTDLDEIVIPSSYYKDLRDYMLKSKKKQTFCAGYEVFMDDSEVPIDYGRPPILKQRKYWYKDETGSYNKPALSRVASDWAMGFHKIRDMGDEDVRRISKTGLYLVHLKHINNNEVIKDNKDRKESIPYFIRRAV